VTSGQVRQRNRSRFRLVTDHIRTQGLLDALAGGELGMSRSESSPPAQVYLERPRRRIGALAEEPVGVAAEFNA
jgi:hypothetical protein